MLSVLISILIALLIFSLIWWILTLIPLPAPFAQVARVVLAVLILIYFVTLLLPYIGHPGLR